MSLESVDYWVQSATCQMATTTGLHSELDLQHLQEPRKVLSYASFGSSISLIDSTLSLWTR